MPSTGGSKSLALISPIMDNSNPHNFEHDPRILARVFYNKAKLQWCVALSLKFIAALLGIILVVTRAPLSTSPIIVFLLAFISEIMQWRSDVHKGCGESITRKIEYHNGFGWPFPAKDMLDNLMKLPAKTRDYIASSIEDNYFASQSNISPQRALENLRESSWWSSQQMGTVIWAYSLSSGLVFALSLFSLFYSISTVSSHANAVAAQNSLETVSKVITSVLSLVLSLGFFKLIVGCVSFKLKSEQVEQNCIHLLKSKDLTEIDAIKTLHEYQLSRAAAPLIPDIVWKIRGKSLNEYWNKYIKEVK